MANTATIKPTGIPEFWSRAALVATRSPSYTRFRMNKFLYGAAALSLALAFTGCDDDDPIGGNGDEGCLLDAECGIYTCDLSKPDEDGNGVCRETCVGNDHCAEGYECGDAGVCELDDIEQVEGYTQVLIVSRTNDDKDAGDCRAPTPGPDIDYVRVERAGGKLSGPKNASGAHGEACGSDKMLDEDKWATPDVALENLSIGKDAAGNDVEDGTCAIDGAVTRYFFMGQGQPYTAGETIAAGTGYLLIGFDDVIDSDDTIEIGEVGMEPGAGGLAQTCSNADIARLGDTYGVYLAHSDVTSVKVGDKLEAPNFIHVKDDLIGLTKTLVVLD